jgi:hypothetical protein
LTPNILNNSAEFASLLREFAALRLNMESVAKI